MPFFNLRLVVITLVVVGLGVGGFFGWRYYQSRPETLLNAAQDNYDKAEKLREANDMPKAKAAYEKAQTAIEQYLSPKFVTDEPVKASQGFLLRYRVLKPLAGIVKTEADAADSKELRLK